MFGEPLVVEESLDQLLALVGAGRFEEVAGLGDAGDGAGQFEVGAAEEDLVAGDVARRQALRAPGRLQPGVDPGGQFRRAFLGIRRTEADREDDQGQHGTPSACFG